MTQRYFEDVEIGETIPDLVVSVDPVQMFYFSAATYNGHRIHYDRTWTTEVEGYPDIVVQGPLQAALLARAVTDWMGGGGWLVRFAVQNRGSAFAGEKLCFSATVTGKREEGAQGLVDLEVKGAKADGQVLMPGTATVRLPRRGDTA